MHVSNQTVRIVHKEYLGPVTGSIGFGVYNSYTLNPNDQVTFPWLYKIARCYQQYKLKGAIFEYVPTSGVAISGSNPAIGSVMMQTTYRATDTAPDTKVELLNEYWSSEGPPNERLVHPIECDPKENPFLIHYVGNPTSDQDRLMYDLGKTFFATQGMPAANPVGDLWLTYDIEFKKPVVKSNAVANFEVATGSFVSRTPTDLFSGGTWSGVGVSGSGNVLTFPPGNSGEWLISVVVISPTGSFSLCDMGLPYVVSNGESDSHYSNYTSGTAPALNYAMRQDRILIDNNSQPATVTATAVYLTPGSDLKVEVSISRMN
jgi:hypothetical protein